MAPSPNPDPGLARESSCPERRGRTADFVGRSVQTSESTGHERQWVRAASGVASESCVELSPVTERTEDGRRLRILVVIDEGARECPARACGRTLHVQKASPGGTGDVESFSGRLRDDLLDRELFLGLPEARVVLDQWRMDYNHRRPHGGLQRLTPVAVVAGLDDTASGEVPAAAYGASPVRAAPLPPAHHADCCPTLS
ncbi:MAG: transposase [Planctomycetia bacterium]|nr:transposase [Planctomycetia bacterium]